MTTSIEVFYNKSTIKTRLILFSCLLVLLPYKVLDYLVTNLNASAFFKNIYLQIIVIISLALFLVVYYYLFEQFKICYKKFTCKKPVFIINELGITDKINCNSVGFIPWRNIQEVNALSSKERYLVFFIKDTNEVMEKFNKIKVGKKIARNFKKNGSNIRVAVKNLDGNVNKLKKIAQAQLANYNKSNGAIVQANRL
ncbi:STM3941 family protein [Parasediminibacterium sp. JCM 36343]|uniref:STM3941 family protein n=1 Tax=Parasediminibacterium sp. JCM 36343 TaxID=3374279 RepID=UPI003979412A